MSQAGRTIGRYEILAELGRGGFGVVWKARHALLPDRLVALKVLSESLWSSPQARERFLREAIAVSKLDHPRIATLYDAEELEGQLYIAFKLIEGETVARKTAEGPLPLRHAVSIGRDAAEGLAHAHAQGVIHRDISPGNVMVDREGRGVLVDFGLARPGDQSATVTAGVTFGTLPYMAPEMFRGEVADARSDLYGLGAVLYRMVTGRAPFEGKRAEEITYRILHSRPAVPSSLIPSVPPELDEVVLRALERDRRDRYASAEEMAGALDGVLRLPGFRDGTPLPIAPGGRLRWGLRRSLRRRSARWLVGAGVAAAVALFGLGLAWTRGWRPIFEPRAPVVAVLPARNLSEDTSETAYLGEAFGEELVARLGQISSLHLVPWLTTQRFANPNQRLQAVGRELGANKLVVGSYRSDGDRVRVTFAVVDSRTGLQNWSQVYEENLEDLFALQQSLATGIASHLRGRLTESEREHLGTAASRSPEAYEYYLRGSDFMNSQDPQTSALAGRYFEKALELDPNLAAAWVGVGAVNTDLYFRGQAGQAELDSADNAFRRALSLSPNLYSAMRGLIRVSFERGEYEEILRIGKKLAGRDDVEALLVRAWAYTLGGLPEKAVPNFDRVLELDPGSQAAAWYRVIASCWAGEAKLASDRAKAYFRKFGTEDPEIYTWLGMSLYTLGEKLQARLCLWRSAELFGIDQSNLYSVSFLIALCGELGETTRADSLAGRWLDILEARHQANPDNSRVLVMRAVFASWLGLAEGDKTLDSMFTNPQSFKGGGPLIAETLGLFRNIPKACLALERLDLAQGNQIVHNGTMRLSLGNRYPAVARLPEFRSLLAAIDRRHTELAARY